MVSHYLSSSPLAPRRSSYEGVDLGHVGDVCCVLVVVVVVVDYVVFVVDVDVVEVGFVLEVL